jgi:hypothetical protein
MKKSKRNRKQLTWVKHALGKIPCYGANSGPTLRHALGLSPRLGLVFEDIRTSMPKGVRVARYRSGGTLLNPVYSYGLRGLGTRGRTGARARMALQIASKGVKESCAHQWWHDRREGGRTSHLYIPAPIRES